MKIINKSEIYASCDECKKNSKETEIYYIKTEEKVLCLCEKHVRILKGKLNLLIE